MVFCISSNTTKFKVLSDVYLRLFMKMYYFCVCLCLIVNK